MRSKKELREQARQLRLNGSSVRDIARILNISKASASMWVRDIVLTEAQVETLKENQRRYGGQNAGGQSNRKKHREQRIQYQEIGRAKARENRPLHLAGCMLYWAEGAKHRNKLYFVNSDPNMLRLFLRFLREELDVEDTNIAVNIHCHYPAPEDIQRIENYWIELLGLPQSCLRKTQVKQGSNSRKNILEYGVCALGVYRTDLTQHVFGAIQEYGGFDNTDWLF